MSTSIAGKAKIVRSLLLIVLILCVGTLAAVGFTAFRVEPPRRDIAVLPPLVDTLEIQRSDVTERFVGYGTARAIHRADVAAEVASTVVECGDEIREGSVVTEGQVLIRLDDREYRHLLARAVALAETEQASRAELEVEAAQLDRLIKTAEQELRVASDEKRRVADLFERELAASKEYDFANLAYQQARRVLQEYQLNRAKIEPRLNRVAASERSYAAEAALARLNIERCVIRAPFDGRVHALEVDLGDRVAPGTVVLTLVDSSRVEVPVQLPASVYDRVHVGAACQVSTEANQRAAWHGEVVRIAPVADERTRTFGAFIVVDNRTDRQHELLPGVFVRAEVQGPVHSDAILIPRGACRNGHVFVVEDGVARTHVVKTERFIKDQALVSGSLSEGDRVVLSYLDKLTDGSPVRVLAGDSLRPSAQQAARTGKAESTP